jgi:hypothetical protein
MHHLNGQTYQSLTTAQPTPWHPRRRFVHGRQETKLQLDLGQRR